MWERIDDYTARLAVPGGWIVRSSIVHTTGVAVHQIFIADDQHSWREAKFDNQ